MSEHLSNEIVERFNSQSLTGGDRGVIYNHILSCESCRRRVVTSETEAAAVAVLTDHFLPRSSEEPYHLDPVAIEAFVDDKLDTFDRNIAKLHLEDCAECSEEVTDLRESLATMRAATRKDESYQPQIVAPRRPFVFAAPMRIAAMVAFIAFAAIALIVVWRWKSSGPAQPGADDTTAGSKPTPVVSPQVPSLTPSPALVIPPPKLAENPPGKGSSEPRTAAVATIKDGTYEISIDQAGNVVGLPSVPVESREAVKQALTGEPLSRPGVLDEVASVDVSVRASTGNEERIKIAYPTNTIIQTDRPTLRWAASKTAEAYRIEIADESFRRIAQSEDLTASTQKWTPSVALKRGQVHTWTIRAVNKGGELSPLTSQGKFKVLSEESVRELTQLKARRSHLALALFYAREGMIAEAEREFQSLVKENPNSAVVKRLFKEFQSWKRR